MVANGSVMRVDDRTAYSNNIIKANHVDAILVDGIVAIVFQEKETLSKLVNEAFTHRGNV